MGDEKVRELEEQVKLLEDAMKKMSASSSKVESKTFFISKDRKLAKFSGRPQKDSDPNVEEWIEDVKYHLRNISGNDAQVEFLYDHLQGQARDEVRTLKEVDRNNPGKILEVLQQLFQDADTIAQIQQQFFQREQRKNESLQQYSLVLLKLVDRMLQKNRTVIGDKELMLKERFIDGVLDHQLRREMRRFSIEHPEISFQDFRKEIFRWTESHKTETSIHSEEVQVNQQKQIDNDLMKILAAQNKMLEEQQKQLNMLSELVKQRDVSSAAPFAGGRGQSGGGYAHRYRGRGSFRGRRRGGPLECFNCHETGHIARECPKPRATDAQESAPNANLNI
ncbi:MAG: zinc finger domain-containing protein [Candidatus Thiodiazotropha taylori]|nr:zinc finger domain-containing protein [Candidatus Thiodiazotropha taylori]